jgi:hypothetical protein
MTVYTLAYEQSPHTSGAAQELTSVEEDKTLEGKQAADIIGGVSLE